MKKILTIVILLSSIHLYGQKPVKVACIGDSVTYGSLIEDRENNSYPAQLQRMLGDEYEVGNFGKPSATVLKKGHCPYMESQEFTDALSFSGDIAVIHLGLNDTDPRNWPNYGNEFTSDYLALIDSVRTSNPDVRILIALLSPVTPKHPRYNTGTMDWHAAIQKEISAIAETAQVELIDFNSRLLSRPDLLPDSVHPTAEGASILADIVFQAISGRSDF